jgi:hypothetical protein
LFKTWPEIVKKDLASFNIFFATNERVVAETKGRVVHANIVNNQTWSKAFPSLDTRPENCVEPEKNLFVDSGLGSSYDALTAESQVQSRKMIGVLARLLDPKNPKDYVLKRQIDEILEIATATLSLRASENYGEWAQPPVDLGIFGLNINNFRQNNNDQRLMKLCERNLYRVASDNKLRKDADLILNSPSRVNAKDISRINIFAPDGIQHAVLFNSRVKPLVEEALPLAPKDYDFAERLGLIRQYPYLAERLGLTLDVRIPADVVAKTLDPSLRVWVTPDWNHGGAVVSKSPATMCSIDIGRKYFAASERSSDGVGDDPEHQHGYLRLPEDKWKLTTLDIDGASIKSGAYGVSRSEIIPSFVTDTRGKLLYANSSAVNLFGNSFAAETNVTKFVKPECMLPIIETLRESNVHRREITRNVTLLDKQNETIDVSQLLHGQLQCFGDGKQSVIDWKVLPKGGTHLAESGPLPSNRSVGLALVRADADVSMINAGKRIEDLFKDGNEPGIPVLVASDLILGYIPEVLAPPAVDPNGKPQWFSLTNREVYFPVLGEKYVAEGQVSVGVAEAHDAAPRDQGDAARQGTVSPGLFSYANVPLGSPLKGRSFTLPESVSNNSDVDPLCVHLTPVPSSLPLIRYSSISDSPFYYQVRCRSVDIAGNSRAFDNKVHSSKGIQLGTWVERQEAVPPPRVLTDGQLNLISNPGAKLKTIVVTDTVGCDTRILIPPKCTADMALRYGKLIDGCLHNGHWKSIQLDDHAEVPDEPCIQLTVNDPKDKRSTPTFRSAKLSLPKTGFYYFPDPACQFASLSLYAFNIKPIRVQIPFYRGCSWPNANSIRITLFALAADEVEPKITVGCNCADIYLPWGWTGHLELSSGLVDSNEDAQRYRHHFSLLSGGGESVFKTLFGIEASRFSKGNPIMEGGILELLETSSLEQNATTSFKNLNATDTHKHKNAFKSKTPFIITQALVRLLKAIPLERRSLHYLLSGSVPELTPHERIDLVCATRRPVVKPSLAINNFTETGINERDLNSTIAKLKISSVVDEKSTSELTIMASWERLQDDPAIGDPDSVWDRTELPIYKLDDPLTYKATQIMWSHDLDLRSATYRRVTYRLTALSRFSQYYAGENKASLSCQGCNEVQIDHLNVTRLREAPVRYLVPIHTWTSSVHPLLIKPNWEFRSSRRSGIRVYLGRGWELEELLGLIVHPTLTQFQANELNAGRYPPITAVTAVMPNLTDSITQWGADPIVRSGLPQDLPTAADFSGFQYVAADLRLPLADGTQLPNCDRNVAVVGFKPEWHPEKKLWYCDIGLRRIPSYGCFLRMVFARLQPKSIKGMELSPPVVADFIQMLPERTVSVVRDPHDKDGRTLCVVIYEPTNEAKTPLDRIAGVSNRFDIQVQQPCAFPTGAEFGWVADDNVQIIPDEEVDDGILWSGKVIIPPSAGRRRLLIREYESWIHKDEKHFRERECYCNTLEL